MSCSKEAERYFENEWANTRAYEVMKSIPIEDAIEEAFDAGVASVNKRIGECPFDNKELMKDCPCKLENIELTEKLKSRPSQDEIDDVAWRDGC